MPRHAPKRCEKDVMMRGMRSLVFCVCLVACSPTSSTVGAPPDASPQDATSAPVADAAAADADAGVTPIACDALKPVSVGLVSEDCTSPGTGVCDCFDAGVEYRCGAPGSETTHPGGMPCFAYADAGVCCPPACVRRSSFDAKCAPGWSAYACAYGLDIDPRCVPATDEPAQRRTVCCPD